MEKESHSADKLAFILGAPRSGTTLLMSMLNCSPEIHVVPENRFFLVYLNHYKNADFQKIEVRKAFAKDFKKYLKHRLQMEGLTFDLWRLDDDIIQAFTLNENIIKYKQAIIALYRSLQLGGNTKKKATIFIEKNPIYTQHIHKFLQYNPTIKFIGIIRNFKDAVSSRVKSNNRLKQNLQYYANYWRLINNDLHQFASIYKQNMILVHYEDLIKDPDETINRLTQFLCISDNFYYSGYQQFYNDIVKEIEASKNFMHKERLLKKFGDLTKPINNSNSGAWRKRLNSKESQLVDLICYTTAQKFGYELDDVNLDAKLSKNTSYYKASLNYYLDDVRFKLNPNFNIFLEQFIRKLKII